MPAFQYAPRSGPSRVSAPASPAPLASSVQLTVRPHPARPVQWLASWSCSMRALGGSFVVSGGSHAAALASARSLLSSALTQHGAQSRHRSTLGA